MLDNLLSENLDILYALIPDNLSSDYDVIPIQMCEVMAILPSAHILAKEMEISFE
jgi:ABC-type microcin C transport system permease subunit YejE